MTNQLFPLAYDVAGSGPLLVALHGITENRTYWDSVPLSQNFRTVRMDLRGHGQSPVTGPFDPVTLATDVHDLVHRLGEQGAPFMVGHSYGGIVATAYASRFPVRGVVNIDQRLDVTPLPAQVADFVRGPGFYSFTSAFFDPFYGDINPALRARLAAQRTPRRDVIEGAWAPLLDLSAEDLAAWITDLLPAPETRYLSLHGLPLDEDYATWLHHFLPAAIVERAPATTHYPHLANPEWFLDRLIQFTLAN
jgi:pimeloyl-ACP methyl ester carboxylesterase